MTRLCFLIAVVALAAVSPLTAQSGNGALAGTDPLPPSEIVFIGANHAYAFLEPGFSPAHIRALLTKISPAAVLVEISPYASEADGIPTYPHEQYAAVTWAATAGVPFYPVNWVPANLRALPAEVRMSDTVAIVSHGPKYEQFLAAYLARAQFSASLAFGEGPNDLESYHREHTPAVVTQWPVEDSTDAVREDSITTMVLAATRRHPGQRLAIVYGAGHYLTLKRRLELAGVRVVPPLEYFPLSPEEVRGGFLTDDAVVLLGANLDDWRTIGMPQNRDHRRTRDLLDVLHRERPHSVAARYFEARWRMLFRDTDSATKLLREIVEEGGHTSFPYRADPRWSWPPFRTLEQKALFYLAASDDLNGDRTSAVDRYRALLALPDRDLVVPALGLGRRVDLRPYLASFLVTPYQGGLLEAYRVELAAGRW